MDDEDEEGLLPFIIPKREDINTVVRELENRLHGMRVCYNVMKKRGAHLQNAITNFELSTASPPDGQLKNASAISEKSTLFGVAARAMLHACESYLKFADSEAHETAKKLYKEVARSRQLEKMIHNVVKDHSNLEQAINSPGNRTTTNFKNDSEQLDHIDIGQDEVLSDDSDSLSVMRQSISQNKPSNDANLVKLRRTLEDDYKDHSEETPNLRRSRIPNRPNVNSNAWSILKTTIGKDLSKIPLPVSFNEPISALQRITEEFEYAELLDTAAGIEDTCEQIAYVAAYSISTYASSADRTGKPFNPLLGETYEFDRTTDFGWRSIAEQVSHHPPISALHCEGRGWEFWEDCSLATKFRGKSLLIQPSGSCNCKFHKTNTAYTWGKVATTVNNIIVGKVWLDQQGEVEISGLNKATGVKCSLTYIPYSVFSSENQRRVNGIITDENGEPKWRVKGFWDKNVEIAPITNLRSLPSNISVNKNTGDFKQLWKRTHPDPESPFYYNFSRFTCELNEQEENIAPTDSRLRPDLRLMELGFWDESNLEKLRLEQKQRQKRNAIALENGSNVDHGDEGHKPLWFTRTRENDKVNYSYNGKYWDAKLKQDWSYCPDIF